MTRLALAALPLIALATPLPAAASEMNDTVATLNDPIAQERMAETITAIVGALMQMQVGPLAKAVAEIDPESDAAYRSEEHTSELQSLMRISYAVFCLKQKNHQEI